MKKFLQNLMLLAAFVLPLAMQAQTVTIGTDTSTSYTPSPFCNYYNNGMSQMLYLASEIGTSGAIDTIWFYHGGSSSVASTTIKIYFATTSNTTLTSFLPAAEFEEAYEGTSVTLGGNTGWQAFVLNTPYYYDGVDNLVVCCTRQSSAYSSSVSWRYTSLSGRIVYRQSDTDGTYADITNTATGTSGAYMFNIKMHFDSTYAAPTCPRVSGFTASNVSSSSFDLSWVETGSATSWVVEYAPNDFVPGNGNGTVVNATDTAVSLTGLTANTTYTVYVHADCGSGDTSTNRKLQVRTSCTELSSDDLPYVENFESYSSGSANPISPCWHKGTNSSTAYPYPYSTAGINSTMGLYFYSYHPSSTTSTAYYCYAALPPLDEDLAANTLQLDFDAKRYSTTSAYYQSMIVVGVMTDPTDISTFDTVQVIDLTAEAASSIHSLEVPLNSYTGTGRYIAFYSPVPALTGSSTYAYNYIYIDNVVLNVLPTCIRPHNLQASYVTSDSVVLTWQPGLDETQWVVTDGTNYIMVNDTTYTLDNLNANTVYHFSVYSYCGSDDSSTMANITVRTACGALTSLPMFEDFENQNTTSSSSNNFIPCWGHLNNGTSYPGYPYLSNSTSYNHTSGGSKGLYWYASTTTGTYGDYHCIVLPQIDTNVFSMNELQVRFWAKASSTSYHPVFYVGVMTDPTDITTFVPVDTIEINGNTAWAEFEAPLSNYEGSGSYAAIKSVRPSSTWYAYVDDITLEELPACAHVDNLAYGFVGDSVQITWTEMGEATQWQIYASTTASTIAMIDNDDAIDVYDTVYYFENMVNGTTYYVYVRPECDGEGPWYGPVVVTPGSVNMPVSGTQTVSGCGLVIYDDGGATGDYSNSCNGTLVVYPSSTDSILRFWGSYQTESVSLDYLKIYEGVGTAGTVLFNMPATTGNIDTTVSMAGPITIQFVSDGSVVYSGFEIHTQCIPAPQCAMISRVEASHIAATSALVSWDYVVGNAGVPNSYELEIEKRGESATTVTTSDQSIFLTGLDADTDYVVRVRSLCDDDATSPWDSVMFSTVNFPCAVLDTTTHDTIVFSTGTAETTGIPVTSAWGNSFCQSIYTAAELSAMGMSAGAITAITLGYTTNSSYAKELTIYLGPTTQTDFGSVSDQVAMNTQTLVYGPAAHQLNTSGWVTYTLATPYLWDGSSNLVLTTFMNQPSGASHSASSFYGYSTAANGNKSIYRYKDSAPWTTSDCTTGNSSTSNYRPSISFETYGCSVTANCVAPNVILSSFGADSASFYWAAGNTETAWDLEYKIATANDWTMAAANYAGTEYTFANLLPNTDYKFRFTSLCGTSEEASVVLSATTSCGATSIPFSENFDTWATGYNFPACWHKGTNYSTQYPSVSTSYAHSGANALYMYSSNTTWSYITLPTFDAPVDTLMVSFMLYASNSSYTHALTVGVMTDPTDFSTFTAVASATPSAVSTWEAFEIPLSGYHGIGSYIAIVSPDGSYSYPYLDDLEVTYIPNCPRPNNITASNISQTGATITWVDSATTNFEIEYGPAGFAHGQGTLVSESTNSTTITGLNNSTMYDVYVRGICSGDDTSNWSFVSHFATACGEITTLPYTENFDNWGTGTTVHAPNCWGASSTYSTTYPYILSYSAVAGHGGVEYFYCYNSTTSSTDYTYMSLPAIDSTLFSMNQLQIIFEHSQNSSTTTYTPYFIVGVGNNPQVDATFVPIDTIQCAAYQTWETAEVSFDQYTGNGRYVIFKSYTTTTSTYSYNYGVLDNISLELIPSCPRVTDLMASNATTTSVDLSWTDRGATTPMGYIIEYGVTDTYVQGQGTQIYSTTNPYTLNGLTPSTNYTFNVRPVCSATDTGLFSRFACTFNTTQPPATVPFSYDFEDSTEWSQWQVNSNTTIGWYRGTADAANGNYSMYVSADGGLTRSNANFSSVVKAATWRDVDFGNVDTSFTFTFKAKAGGTISAYYDGLMVFLADPTTPVDNSAASVLESPWGNINDLYRIATVRLDTVWHTVTASFDDVSGVQRVAFYWFNQNTGASYAYQPGPAAIDDIVIDYSACPRPTNLDVDNVTSTSAHLTWNAPTSGNYEIAYRPYPNGTHNTYVQCNTNSYTLTGLDPMTQYAYWVRKLCGSDSSIFSDGVLFTTSMCDGAVIAENFDSTMSVSSTSYGPAYAFYNYSFSQTIIDSAWLSGVGQINAFAFNPSTTTAGDYYTNCEVWLTPTTMSTIASGVDMDSTSVKVFDGDLSFEDTGWQTFGFDTVFNWDGSSNLILTVIRHHGTYLSGCGFNAVSGSTTKMFYGYSDTYDPSASSLSLYSGSTGSSAIYPQYQLVSCGGVSICNAPSALTATNVTYNSATFTWTGNGANYEVAYKAANAGQWSAETPVSAMTYTVNGLSPETDYQFRVRQDCDSIGYSDWVVLDFTTDELPCFAPENLVASNVEGFSAQLSWTGHAETSWEVAVFNTTYSNNVTVTANPTTVTLPAAGTQYFAAVRALCGDGTVESDWSDTISFTTDICDPVTNVAATVNGTSATITWNAGENNNGQWEIEYGLSGFSQGEGTMVQVTNTSATINNLYDETSYDAYVRAICGSNYVSTWSNKVTFTTEHIGISHVDGGMNVSIYPNPATGATTISLSGVDGIVNIAIVDMNGRTILTDAMECQGDCVKKMNVDNLAQGAYFVRIYSDSVNTVKKLIVR